ncbi:hypothetical protein EV360DRAFT_89837 [Lentinula raphanica]|nr:hypothetical protein EV360DRAFT_89837 [Lentinula raphanica]
MTIVNGILWNQPSAAFQDHLAPQGVVHQSVGVFCTPFLPSFLPAHLQQAEPPTLSLDFERNISSDAKVALGATKIALSSAQSALQFIPIPEIAPALDGLLAVINAFETTEDHTALIGEQQRIRHQGLLKRLLLQEDIQTAILNMNQKIKNALDAFTLESNNTQERTTAKTHDNVEGLVITTNANKAEIREVGKQVGQYDLQFQSEIH